MTDGSPDGRMPKMTDEAAASAGALTTVTGEPIAARLVRDEDVGGFGVGRDGGARPARIFTDLPSQAVADGRDVTFTIRRRPPTVAASAGGRILFGARSLPFA